MNTVFHWGSQSFEQLEDSAIDGELDYTDFPPPEYKYFSRLAKLGYLNRHKGWGVELCEQKQAEYRDVYKTERDEADRFLHLSQRIQENVMSTSDNVRQMYKSQNPREIVDLSFKTIENLTNENGFAKRMSERLNALLNSAPNGNAEALDKLDKVLAEVKNDAAKKMEN